MNSSLTGSDINYIAEKTGAKINVSNNETLWLRENKSKNFFSFINRTMIDINETSKFEKNISNKSLKIITYEGQVEEIIEENAIASFKTDEGFVKKRIKKDRLINCNADYIGAIIRVTVKEQEGGINYKYERVSEEPYWEHPDEEFINITKELKKNIKQK